MEESSDFGRKRPAFPKLPFVLAFIFSIPFFFLLMFFVQVKNQSIEFSLAEVQGIYQFKSLYHDLRGSVDKEFKNHRRFSLSQFQEQIERASDASNLIRLGFLACYSQSW